MRLVVKMFLHKANTKKKIFLVLSFENSIFVHRRFHEWIGEKAGFNEQLAFNPPGSNHPSGSRTFLRQVKK